MNFIDGKLYRLMQRANIPDALVLRIDDILRNDSVCSIKEVEKFVKHILKSQKQIMKSNFEAYNRLLELFNFKRGDLLKILLKEQKLL